MYSCFEYLVWTSFIVIGIQDYRVMLFRPLSLASRYLSPLVISCISLSLASRYLSHLVISRISLSLASRYLSPFVISRLSLSLASRYLSPLVISSFVSNIRLIQDACMIRLQKQMINPVIDLWSTIYFFFFFFLYFDTTHYAQLTVSRFTPINQSIMHFKSMFHEVQWTVQCYDLPIQLNTYNWIHTSTYLYWIKPYTFSVWISSIR